MKKKVGILGATGAVGQRMIQMLENHPWFEVTSLGASKNSAGKPYQEAVNWRMETPIPVGLANKLVVPCIPGHDDVDFVLSALPSGQARELEPKFAQAGYAVVSNASAFRDADDVPLVVPEINPDHTNGIEDQQRERGWSGFIVTNPNCVALGFVMPLKALDDAFGLEKVNVVSFQARSGAGYPGPPPEVIDDNVLPYIAGEEEKVEREPQKILGHWRNPAPFAVSAQCNRVNVSDGHFKCLNIGIKMEATQEEVENVLASYQGLPQKVGLPSAPEFPILLSEDPNRPQPKLDRDNGKGMVVTVGRVRPCPLFDWRMAVLSHNTIRGAAGAAVLNAELLVHQNRI